ncbi:hypothetical protein HK405_005910 [Cladochytrium tenue]|nr:hypothetical protein HK405_005910 [Cladochytrium tenue]
MARAVSSAPLSPGGDGAIFHFEHDDDVPTDSTAATSSSSSSALSSSSGSPDLGPAVRGSSASQSLRVDETFQSYAGSSPPTAASLRGKRASAIADTLFSPPSHNHTGLMPPPLSSQPIAFGSLGVGRSSLARSIPSASDLRLPFAHATSPPSLSDPKFGIIGSSPASTRYGLQEGPSSHPFAADPLSSSSGLPVRRKLSAWDVPGGGGGDADPLLHHDLVPRLQLASPRLVGLASIRPAAAVAAEPARVAAGSQRPVVSSLSSMLPPPFPERRHEPAPPSAVDGDVAVQRLRPPPTSPIFVAQAQPPLQTPLSLLSSSFGHHQPPPPGSAAGSFDPSPSLLPRRPSAFYGQPPPPGLAHHGFTSTAPSPFLSPLLTPIGEKNIWGAPDFSMDAPLPPAAGGTGSTPKFVGAGSFGRVASFGSLALLGTSGPSGPAASASLSMFDNGSSLMFGSRAGGGEFRAPVPTEQPSTTRMVPSALLASGNSIGGNGGVYHDRAAPRADHRLPPDEFEEHAAQPQFLPHARRPFSRPQAPAPDGLSRTSGPHHVIVDGGSHPPLYPTVSMNGGSGGAFGRGSQALLDGRGHSPHVPLPQQQPSFSNSASTYSASSSASASITGAAAAAVVPGTPADLPIVREIQTSKLRVDESRLTQDYFDRLAREVSALSARLALSSDELRRQDRAFDAVTDAVHLAFPDATVFVLGGAESGMDLAGTEMEIAVALPESNRLGAAQCVDKLGHMLKQVGMKDVKMLTRARVPVARLQEPASGVRCDVSFHPPSAPAAAGLLRAYARLDPRLPLLARAVRCWAWRRGINEPHLGTLSSYCFQLMVIHLLQHRGVVPCLQRVVRQDALTGAVETSFEFAATDGHSTDGLPEGDANNGGWVSRNRESLGELLVAFFKYYSAEFPYVHGVASVRCGRVLSKEEKGWTKERQQELNRSGSVKDRFWLCIEDPLDPSYNVGRPIDKETLFEVRGEFIRASKILCGGPPDSVVTSAAASVMFPPLPTPAATASAGQITVTSAPTTHADADTSAPPLSQAPSPLPPAPALPPPSVAAPVDPFAPILALVCEPSPGPASLAGKRASAGFLAASSSSFLSHPPAYSSAAAVGQPSLPAQPIAGPAVAAAAAAAAAAGLLPPAAVTSMQMHAHNVGLTASGGGTPVAPSTMTTTATTATADATATGTATKPVGAIPAAPEESAASTVVRPASPPSPDQQQHAADPAAASWPAEIPVAAAV